MSGFGSFSQEAYEQLQQAYAAQLQKAEETEEQGVKIGSDTLGVETAPVRSAWLDKTGLWQYPDGRGERQDVEQKQQDLLAALRDSEGNLPADDDELELSDMSDEELDAMIDEVLAEIDGEGEADPGDDGDDDADPEFDALVQRMLEGIDEDTTDEEIDAMLDELLGPADDEEEEDESEEPDGDGEPEPEPDADDIAARIAELKAELAALTEDGEEEEEEEEEDEDYAPEETQGEEEETEPDVTEDETEEEDPSDDEPN